MAAASFFAWFLLVHARILLYGQYLPEVINCNGFAREWGVCPGLPPCFEAVHCQFDEWEDWYYDGGCTGICTRRRQVKDFGNEHGAGCDGPIGSTKDCTDEPSYQESCYNGNAQGLPLYGDAGGCQWQPWSDWSGCDRQCGGGEKTRDRQIAKAPEPGGAPCSPEVTEQITPCNTEPCVTCIDGKWGTWAEWQPCSVTCGAGLRWRERDEEVKANQCGRPAIGSSREFKPCHGVIDEDLRCPMENADKRCMLGDWEEWAPCEAQCDVGRRNRQRPFKLNDVRHYETDLEHQVFRLEFGNEQLEKQRNVMFLNITSLQREVEKLKADKSVATMSLRRQRTMVDALTANLSHANFLAAALQKQIKRLQEDKDTLSHKAIQPTLPPVLPARPTDAVDNTDQVGAFTGLALLVFVAALGITCACVACNCTKLLRKRPRTHNFDDRPEHPETSEEDIKRDGEAQPWRPLRLDEAPLSNEQAIPAE